MKDDLPYFSHDNDSRNHPKMKALRARYGWTGYGQFWALNEMIAGSSGARLDLGRKVVRASCACELGMTTDALDDFLSFLANDDECGLIDYVDGIVTTDRTQEDIGRVTMERERKRSFGKTSTEKRKTSTEKTENGAEKTNRVEKSREEKRREENNKETPVFFDPGKDVIQEPEAKRPKTMYNPNNPSETFETLRARWNSKPELPAFRRLFLNLFDEEREVVLRMLVYGPDKLCEAIENYNAVIDDPDRYGFDTRYAFKSLPNFLKSAERYFEKPREAEKQELVEAGSKGVYHFNTEDFGL
jgi:hypothetical protein